MGAARTGHQSVIENKVGQKVRVGCRQGTDVASDCGILIDGVRIQSDRQRGLVDVDDGNEDDLFVSQIRRVGRCDADQEELIGFVIEGFQGEKLVADDLESSIVDVAQSIGHAVAKRVPSVRITARQGPDESPYGRIFGD